VLAVQGIAVQGYPRKTGHFIASVT
jgi:hypothetical protein